MKRIDYSRFNTIDEVRAYYNLPEMVTEKKVDLPGDKKGEDEDDATKVVNTDKLQVIYSDLKQDIKNIFKHIIIFTNDRDPKNNKTLKNIIDAIDAIKKAKCEIIPELHVFIAADIDATDDESEITITDGDEKFVIKAKFFVKTSSIRSD